jgi:anti-sigma factor (TIGR02949 family)
MTCDEVFARLDDYVDRELAPAELDAIRAHLATCAQCAREHAFESTIIANVRQKLQRIDLPPNLMQAIRDRLGDTGCGPEESKRPTPEHEGDRT